MSRRIHILSEDLANRIAAGEVVERPASVVKELVENSLDAGGDRIAVHAVRGGAASIRVVDNGRGMESEDARIAFLRHATSKIRKAEDLDGIQTLGFRGEALASIAAVARMVLQTKEKGGWSGTLVEISGGRIEKISETGCPEGTDIRVADLFFNVPARKAFLRTPATEFGHILGLMGQFGLAYPGIHFSLIHNDRLHLELPPVNSLVERVAQIYGEETASRLTGVSREADGLEITGLISTPPDAYPDRGMQEFFVNGRAVRNVSLSHGVSSVFQDLIPRGRHPAVFLFLRLPPEWVDVNVHPTKREVRFREPSRIHEAVARAVRSALGRGGVSEERAEGRHPGGASVVREGNRDYGSSAGLRDAGPERPMAVGSTPVAEIPLRRESEAEDRLFPDVRILGQVHQLYILAEVEGELRMIDQHAAHERVLYDRLKASHDRAAVEVQRLLFPERIELSPQEGEALGEIGGLLSEMGFDLEPFGGRTFLLRSVPALLSREDPARLVREVLSEWRRSERRMGMDDLLMELTGRQACRRAVRGGMFMGDAAMGALVRQLFETEMPYTCPHGRPVVWRIPLEEIEKRFERR